MNFETDVDLIVTVVKKGWGDSALKASIDAGAKGGTIVYGRGVGIHEQKTLLGVRIEPEKEVLLTAVRSECCDVVLTAISEAVELDKPGNGVSMVIPLKKVAGRVHLTDDTDTDAEGEPPRSEMSAEPPPEKG